MCDHDPNDETVLRQPAAPLSPQDIAEDHGWYTAHRRRVEAAHAAAKADHPGIDMDLLGKLCREETDADTKREVAAMMDGLNRTETER
ncbi:hypothetical protein E6C67_08305 [Azospirillum sp. TSA2s]|uniref:hypothetical protein n=1 Tax=Azospirillum sp. TSA2s TaxID=709810 RepID=UPI0010AAA541|nr:hypothetical protein [Azospirillum sp. TSA2s]QCG93941.1 hypothetical protein E6C67_08305 [Azospirillum sp. TSA2s]